MPNIDIRTITAPSHPHAHRADSTAHDYSRNPLIVYWEMTQACGLACRHCRAEACSNAAPDQLNREESSRLLHQIASFDKPLPHLILTGGDPLERPDLFDLIDEARSLGIATSITPAATTKLTFEVMAKLKDHGIDSFGLSLDGSTAERHEGIRNVKGCYDTTLQALRHAAQLNIPVQVNTLVSAETIDDMPAVYQLLKREKVMRWSLYFLIEVGRGRVLQPVTAERGEEFMRWVFDLSQIAPFAIKTTEAPSFRRIALDRMREQGRTAAEIARTPVYRGFGIRDGHGIVFVGQQGDVCPAGFLPLAAGNIRTGDLATIYRSSPIFQSLHTPSEFRGKCGRCSYNAICGGSRARAFGATGDPLASDPFCSYEPPPRQAVAAQAGVAVGA
ncbi:MAG: TIGR04053 family radical SAM/SPASM domain-containing protein [Acidobacteriota bacterium]